ncbi:LysR family transcriptional regulator, partial [Burkholderia contaminans]
PEPHPIHVVYRQDRRPLPKLTRFVEYLIEQVGGRDGA